LSLWTGALAAALWEAPFVDFVSWRAAVEGAVRAVFAALDSLIAAARSCAGAVIAILPARAVVTVVGRTPFSEVTFTWCSVLPVACSTSVAGGPFARTNPLETEKLVAR